MTGAGAKTMITINDSAGSELFDEIDKELIKRTPYTFARRFGAVPVSRVKEGVITLVRSEGADPVALSEYRRVFMAPIITHSVNEQKFDELLESIYAHHATDVNEAVDSNVIGGDETALSETLGNIEDLLVADDDAPIIKLINALLTQALRDHASDIHFEIFESRASVRLRIDGRLKNVFAPPREIFSTLTSRLKVMANLDIAEKRLPQDGRFSLRLGRRPIDVRISTIPSSRGERVVLRLLEKQGDHLTLGTIGIDERTREQFREIIEKPHGIILVTGPTGSGKTTTLYTAIGHLDKSTLNIMTVEDPIEYELGGISQTPVNAMIDMTFARALRAILRQDPDVIMIGEIRDTETARIAVQASLTGHLVLSTLHTNDAVGAITRLIDMEVEPYLLASSLLGVIAQRLVRTLCPVCKVSSESDKKTRRLTGGLENTFHPVGCDQCHRTGYKGRLGIFELVEINDSIKTLIHDGASEQIIRDRCRAEGKTVPLKESVMKLVAEGKTSLEESLRVVEN